MVPRRETQTKRRKYNEKIFGHWAELPDGRRRYWYDVENSWGWKARYVKEVDDQERTTRFYQEIYNNFETLVEVHQKFPIDTGHKKVI